MESKSECTLNDQQQEAMNAVSTGKNILLIGSAGVGKSYLIDYIRQDFDSKERNYLVLAPTGVAALNINGQTIHRALGLRPTIISIEDYYKFSKFSKVKWSTLRTIIIDVRLFISILLIFIGSINASSYFI